MRDTRMLSVPFLLALALAVAGCSTPYTAICDKVQECSGGNDMDVAACVAAGDTAGDVASAYGCADQYSVYAECLEAKGTCDNGHYRAECDDEKDALEKCQDAASALDSNPF